jgi:hypothetical protein
LQASDKDSGENGRITYVVSEPISQIPNIKSSTYERSYSESDAGNIAGQGTANQTDGSTASLAIDGNSSTCTTVGGQHPTWTIDLRQEAIIYMVKVITEEKQNGMQVSFNDSNKKQVLKNNKPAVCGNDTCIETGGVIANSVQIQLPGNARTLTLCEVQIIGHNIEHYVENITLDWNVTVQVFALDNGNPKRGDFVTASIKYKHSCHLSGKLTINATNGSLYFRAPKYSLKEIYTSNLAVNMTTYQPEGSTITGYAVDGFTWDPKKNISKQCAVSNGDNPWWRVDLGLDYIIEKVVIHPRMDCCQEKLSELTISITHSNSQVKFGPKKGPILTSYQKVEFLPNVYARHVKLELLGVNKQLELCEVEVFGKEDINIIEDCYPCSAGKYCTGDGIYRPCGTNSTNKYDFAFGYSEKCRHCMEGFLCHNGTLRKCPENTYVKCNETWCPEECIPCPPGTSCVDGIKTDCGVGTWSNGQGPCRACWPGRYNNMTLAQSCKCCPAGFESTNRKDGCRECNTNEYSLSNCNATGFTRQQICMTCDPPGIC